MIISGYRVYKYGGAAFKHMFLHSVKLDEFPTLIFIKSKIVNL